MRGYPGFEGLLNQIGKNCRFDLLLDGTMSSSKQFEQTIDALREAGYKVYIIYVQVDDDLSRERAAQRYKNGGDKGRYVPQFVIDEAIEAGLKPFNKVKAQADGYWLVDGSTHETIEKGGEELPKDRNYKQLGGEPVKAKKAKKKDRSANVLAEYLALQAENVRVGNAPDNERVKTVLRTKGGMPVLEKANGELLALDEKTRTLSKFREGREGLKKVEGTSALVEKLYKSQPEQLCAMEIEAKINECRAGTCSKDEVALYRRMAAQCRENSRREKFVQGISKLFDEIFASQRRGQKFEYAYNTKE